MSETPLQTTAATRQSAFVKSAARASVAAPVVAWALGYLDADMGREDHSTAIFLLAVHWTLIGVGLLLACTALLLMRRHGTSGVVAPAVLGLLINLFGVASIIYLFFGPGSHSSTLRGSSSERWQQFDSRAGRFKVEFPGAAVESTALQSGIERHQAYLELPDGSAFGVTWLTPPVLADPIDEDAAQKLLDEVVQKQIGMGGELLDLHTVSIDGHTGRELRVKKVGRNGPVVLVQRQYIAGTHTYQVMVEIGAGEQGTRAAEVSRFLDSFRMTGP
ncbi:MAG TPA: hypothetical protein VG269_13635 [Tepidisphaeraceae bacterium]|jgi:hypothetical protein|nr:hypothetical protein [Tepidisphaeraceae bacterium]